MQGAEERRLRRISNTPQACREPLGLELGAERPQGRTREAAEGNAALRLCSGHEPLSNGR
ncbi:hypothetical protein ACFL0H_13290 [Thermodesulfobacteriota bacterium]